jgi:hypothetical protein
MAASKQKYMVFFLISLALFSFGSVSVFGGGAADPVLPEGLKIQPVYQAGAGLPVGKIQRVCGKVIIFHTDMMNAYPAKIGFPLFEGDTLAAGENASLRFQLSDGSIVRLAAESKLAVQHCSYDPRGKRSLAYLSLVAGQAYFQVKKLIGFEPREFSVEAGGVVAGGTQADFIVGTTGVTTEITALKNAVVEVMNLADPEQKILLSEYQRVVVENGVLPPTVEVIPTEKARQLSSEFLQSRQKDLSDLTTDKSEMKAAAEDETAPQEETHKGFLP